MELSLSCFLLSASSSLRGLLDSFMASSKSIAAIPLERCEQTTERIQTCDRQRESNATFPACSFWEFSMRRRPKLSAFSRFKTPPLMPSPRRTAGAPVIIHTICTIKHGDRLSYRSQPTSVRCQNRWARLVRGLDRVWIRRSHCLHCLQLATVLLLENHLLQGAAAQSCLTHRKMHMRRVQRVRAEVAPKIHRIWQHWSLVFVAERICMLGNCR